MRRLAIVIFLLGLIAYFAYPIYEYHRAVARIEQQKKEGRARALKLLIEKRKKYLEYRRTRPLANLNPQYKEVRRKIDSTAEYFLFNKPITEY